MATSAPVTVRPRRWLGTAALLLVLSAAPLAAQPAVEAETATFAYAGAGTLVDVYLAIEAASLTFERDGQGATAEVPFRLTLTEASAADPAWVDTTVVRFRMQAPDSVRAGQFFIHQRRGLVFPGAYQLRVEVLGSGGVAAPVVERQAVEVPAYDPTEVALSDVVLATRIQASDAPDAPGYRYGLVIEPNPRRLYGSDRAQVFYYAEAYGAEQLTTASGAYRVQTRILGPDGAALPKTTRRAEQVPQPRDLVVGAYDVSGLPSGTYTFEVALLDATAAVAARREQRLYLYNPGVVAATGGGLTADEAAGRYAAMPDDLVADEVRQTRLLASRQERRRARGIQDPDEQRRFLADFWEKRDPSPGTLRNEARETFVRRVRYANDQFASSMREGWRTDRGRVLVKYGEPSNIESNRYQPSTVPHDIWRYDYLEGEGSAIFVFSDPEGFGSFELLHSSVAGEREAPNWQALLRR